MYIPPPRDTCTYTCTMYMYSYIPLPRNTCINVSVVLCKQIYMYMKMKIRVPSMLAKGVKHNEQTNTTNKQPQWLRKFIKYNSYNGLENIKTTTMA